MKRFIHSAFLVAVVCIGGITVQAQRQILSLQPKHITISSSAFSNVLVVDSRLDTFTMGFIQKGGLYQFYMVKTALPLKDELALTVNNMIAGANKQEGTLCINIRQFALTEFLSRGLGIFRISAVFYLKRADTYRKILTVNTRVIVGKGRGEAGQQLLDTVPEVLGSFIQQAAGFDTTNHFAARYIDEIDVEEKKALPAYQAGVVQKGLYATFDDFKNNRPSQQVFLYYKDGITVPDVYGLKENGMKGKRIKLNTFYAVSDGWKMYVAGFYDLYRLTNENNDFYFKSIGKEATDGLPIEPGQPIGISRPGKEPPYDFSTILHKIDHVTGNFIAVKREPQ